MTKNITEIRELKELYRDQVEAWERFCSSIPEGDFEEVDFSNMCLGFLIASGVKGDSDTGEDYYDAKRLSCWL